jgi:hypothetical protein
VLAHGDAAAREIDDHGSCSGRKGAVREDAHREVPLSLRGGGAGGGGGLEGKGAVLFGVLKERGEIPHGEGRIFDLYSEHRFGRRAGWHVVANETRLRNCNGAWRGYMRFWRRVTVGCETRRQGVTMCHHEGRSFGYVFANETPKPAERFGDGHPSNSF